jgi:hypothetical protein
VVSYIEMCQEVSQDVFDLLIHLFGTRRIEPVQNRFRTGSAEPVQPIRFSLGRGLWAD